MAFWGAPQNDKDHALHACEVALLCQKRLIDLNRKWIYEKKPELITRIGLHTGDVIVGNLGSSERMNYTILGDSVNLAARLEGTNKMYNTNIIISQEMYKMLGDENALVRPLDVVAVKGKNEGVKIYELVALINANPLLIPTQQQIDFCKQFSKGFQLYHEQRWEEALHQFTNIVSTYGQDYTTEMYIQRCETYKDSPPNSNWDGIYHLKNK
jgi:adenylate cyclase